MKVFHEDATYSEIELSASELSDLLFHRDVWVISNQHSHPNSPSLVVRLYREKAKENKNRRTEEKTEASDSI